MSFGLTNALAVLMNLANRILKRFLDDYVIMFIEIFDIFTERGEI